MIRSFALKADNCSDKATESIELLDGGEQGGSEARSDEHP